MGLPDIIKLFTREGRKFYFFLAHTAGYLPRNTEVFRSAFVHKSAGKRLNGVDLPDNNERLEYLGDAVIETVVSDILYHKYPDADEGFLSHIRSNMVCRARLNAISYSLGLDEYVVIAQRRDMENSHISGDVLEAFVAAIYLDGGIKRAFKFIKRTIASPERIEEALHDTSQTNYKSMLVNLGEQNDIEILFDTRRTENVRRTDEEAANFVCEIKIANTAVAQGLGRSKKLAEQRASEAVCKDIESGKIDLAQLKEGAQESAETTTAPDDAESTTAEAIAPAPQPDVDETKEIIKGILEGKPETAVLMAEKAAHGADATDYSSIVKEFAEKQKEAAPDQEQPA